MPQIREQFFCSSRLEAFKLNPFVLFALYLTEEYRSVKQYHADNYQYTKNRPDGVYFFTMFALEKHKNIMYYIA